MVSVDRKSSVTVRIPNSILDNLDDMVTRKVYPDRSEAIRCLILDGEHLGKIIQIAKDPKKSKQVVKTLQNIRNIKDIKKVLQTMEPHQLKLVEALAVDISNDKVKQTLLDMKE